MCRTGVAVQVTVAYRQYKTGDCLKVVLENDLLGKCIVVQCRSVATKPTLLSQDLVMLLAKLVLGDTTNHPPMALLMMLLSGVLLVLLTVLVLVVIVLCVLLGQRWSHRVGTPIQAVDDGTNSFVVIGLSFRTERWP